MSGSETWGEGEGPTARVENPEGQGRFVLVCDHASAHIPTDFLNLGLAAEHLRAHIAWDSGALEVARVLCRELDSPLVYPTVSRLLIDCNRDPDRDDLIPLLSDGVEIPGNLGLSAAQRVERIRRVHAPFHALVDETLRAREEAGRQVALVGVHTFTPQLASRPSPRPWAVGVLFEREEALPRRVLAALRASGDFAVGENQPYRPADGVYATLARHAFARGLESVMIELRNDEVATPQAIKRWAHHLATALSPPPDPG